MKIIVNVIPSLREKKKIQILLFFKPQVLKHFHFYK